MVGSSMMMASFGFMIYAISPAYSNSELEKLEMNKEDKLSTPLGTNGAVVGDFVHFVDGGYIYSYDKSDLYTRYISYSPNKKKLP